MPLTNYARQQIIKGVIGKEYFGRRPNSTGGNTTTTYPFYLALSKTQPDVYGGSISEPSAGLGYSRTNLDNSLFSGDAIFNSTPDYDGTNDVYSFTNVADIVFPEATGSWGTITHFAIYDAKTGGNMIAFGTLASPISPQVNTVPIVRAGQMTVSEEQAS